MYVHTFHATVAENGVIINIIDIYQ